VDPDLDRACLPFKLTLASLPTAELTLPLKQFTDILPLLVSTATDTTAAAAAAAITAAATPQVRDVAAGVWELQAKRRAAAFHAQQAAQSGKESQSQQHQYQQQQQQQQQQPSSKRQRSSGSSRDRDRDRDHHGHHNSRQVSSRGSPCTSSCATLYTRLPAVCSRQNH
jgi:hypothetical protein